MDLDLPFPLWLIPPGFFYHGAEADVSIKAIFTGHFVQIVLAKVSRESKREKVKRKG